MLNYQLLIFNCQFFQSLRFMKAFLRAERSIVNYQLSSPHRLRLVPATVAALGECLQFALDELAAKG